MLMFLSIEYRDILFSYWLQWTYFLTYQLLLFCFNISQIVRIPQWFFHLENLHKLERDSASQKYDLDWWLKGSNVRKDRTRTQGIPWDTP